MPAVQAQQIEAPKEDSTAEIEKKQEPMPTSKPETLEELQQEAREISVQKPIEAGEGKKETEKEKTPSSVYGREVAVGCAVEVVG